MKPGAGCRTCISNPTSKSSILQKQTFRKKAASTPGKAHAGAAPHQHVHIIMRLTEHTILSRNSKFKESEKQRSQVQKTYVLRGGNTIFCYGLRQVSIYTRLACDPQGPASQVLGSNSGMLRLEGNPGFVNASRVLYHRATALPL